MVDIYAFTDLHGNLDALKEGLRKGEKCDLIICAGDLSTFGAGLGEMIAELKKSKVRVMLVPGNHETFGEINALAPGLNIDAKVVSFKGLNFAGIGGSNRTPFNTPNEWEESEARALLRNFRGIKNLVLVSHAPPKGYLDSTGGINTGSAAVREFIDEEGPLLVICGHIHEHAGESVKAGPTTIINPGYGTLIRIKGGKIVLVERTKC